MEFQTNSHISPVNSGWGYAAETVPTILAITNLQRNAWVAEINAGVGDFTRHLIGRFRYILAFEPDSDQRAAAYHRLGHFPSYCSIHGNPDSTNLFDNSIDVIVSAQPAAIVKPETALQGCRRILRPPAWFVIVRNYLADDCLGQFLQRSLSNELLSVSLPLSPLDDRLLSICYSDRDYVKMVFSLRLWMSWSQFLNHSRIAFKKAGHFQCEDGIEAKSLEIIKTLEIHGQICLQMRTEVFIGKLRESSLKNA